LYPSAGVFQHSRDCAKKLAESYLEYAMGTAVYNVIDAQNAEYVLNDPNLIKKAIVYNFLHPFLRTGLLTSTGEFEIGFTLIFIFSHEITLSGRKWHARRKMLTPTFHFNILNQFQEVFK